MNSICINLICLLTSIFFSFTATPAMQQLSPSSALHTFMAQSYLPRLEKATDGELPQLLREIKAEEPALEQSIKTSLHHEIQKTVLALALTADGQGSCHMYAQPRAVQKVALSPDGNTVAIIAADRCITHAKDTGIKTEIASIHPPSSIAFQDNTLLLTDHQSLAQSYPPSYAAPSVATLPANVNTILSSNGQWLLSEKIENTENDALVIALEELKKGDTIIIPNLATLINHVHTLAANTAGNTFIIASPAKLILLTLERKDAKTFSCKYKKINENSHPSLIIDADITPCGTHALAAGHKELYTYTPNTMSMEKHLLSHYIHAARFSPKGHLIALGGRKGIELFNWQKNITTRLFNYNGEQISTLAFSADGTTLAFGTEKAAYVASTLFLLQQLDLGQYLLLKKFHTEESKPLLISPFFQDIFKKVPAYLQERLVRIFEIDYKKLGYEECPICQETIAGYTTSCKHAFCHQCVYNLHRNPSADENNVEIVQCPLCRKCIENSTKFPVS